MLKRGWFLLLALPVVLLAIPAAAAERVNSLPAVEPTMSGRFELALVLNDQPFIVGKGELASATRAHFVLQSVPLAGEPVETIEVVVIDDTIYTREGDDTQWYVSTQTNIPVAQPGADPEVDIAAAPISMIGTKDIAGTPTDQYQIWIAEKGAKGSDHIALDFFIGRAVKYLHQYQVSIFETDEQLGQLKLETVVRSYDFNDPSIVVNAPENAIPAPVTASGLVAPMRNGGVLSTLAAPLSTPQLRALAVRRLSH